MPSEPSRLHPASLLFSIGSAARRLILPGIVLLFFSRGNNPEIWLMLLFVPTAIAAVIKYLSFRYRLGADELVIREGVLTRNERHVPYARIQNIDLVQNPFHRWLRVAHIRIETAGGDEPEANIQVLGLGAVEEMRARVFRGREVAAAVAGAAVADGAVTATPAEGDAAAVATPAPPRHEVLSLPTRELVLHGLISNRGMAVVLAAWGLIWQAKWQGWLPEEIDQWIGALGEAETWVSGSAGPPSPVKIAGLVVGGLALFIVLLRVFSIVWAIVKLHGFRLTRTGDDLRASYGLFTRRTSTTPRHRVQLLTVRATPLHRLFKRIEVKVETAGGGKREEDSSVSRQLLAPLMPTERLGELLAQVQPETDLEQLDWQPIHRRAWVRIFNKLMALIAILAAIATLSSGPRVLYGLLVAVPLAAWSARALYKRIRYATGPGFVAYRSGWWTQRLSVARFAKIQAVDLGQTPFDRRARMAWVRVDTAGAGPTGHRIRIPYLGIDVARSVFRHLSLETARTDFRW
jgi:putative membrane protein